MILAHVEAEKSTKNVAGHNMGKLTTHVLDTANGIPAEGMKIRLYRDERGQRRLVTETTTNSDGRCSAPLLEGANFVSGQYELEFSAGDYFRAKASLPDPAFLEIVPIKFGIANAHAHYHVPLLISPWSYSTYRGS
jgi:5-hydroxyisourate hydrolase